MKITIEGIKDESYVSKKDNTPIEQVRVNFTSENVDGVIGRYCSNDLLTARRCPSAVAELLKLGDKAIGKKALISKGATEYNGMAYSYVDEFEFLS